MASSLPAVASSEPNPSSHFASGRTWMRRLLGVLLGGAAFYLLAIDQLSPHHLPGLRWLAFSVAAAGTMSIFLSTRFRRIEAACCVAAVAFGLLAVVDIARVGSQAHPSKKPTASVPAGASQG